MSSPKPQDFPLLLEVFRDGLARGVVSKDKVVAWADDIIKNTDEPDFFFIELSMAGNVNRLIEVFDLHNTSDETRLSARVLLGLIHKRLTDDDDILTVEDAAELVGSLESFDKMTPFERNKIFLFEEYCMFYLPDVALLQVEITDFLGIYKDFNLENYTQWPQINSKVEETVTQKQIEEDIAKAAFMKGLRKGARKRKLKLYARRGLVILGFLAFIIAGSILLNGGLPNSPGSIPPLYSLVISFMLWWAIRLWKKRNMQNRGDR